LPKIYRTLSPGGIVVVDDCKAPNVYDGDLLAYEEFLQEEGLPSKIVVDKLGVLRRPCMEP